MDMSSAAPREGTNFAIGDEIRLKGKPSKVGRVLRLLGEGARALAHVQFSDGLRKVPTDQLELVPREPDLPIDLLRSGILEGPDSLRRHIAHIRLSGRLADMLYSLETTDTTFFAHQFKPILKMLDSPTGNLLIADEVGLGKTIEAGLIWTELAARFQYKRLLVVCPKVLCDKWKLELETKFGLDARIYNAKELAEALSSPSMQKRGFVAICGMQSIRPRPRDDRAKSNSDVLANLMDEIEEFDNRIDLLVVDEAHHMRNVGTQTNALGHALTRIANNVVMLSATPINLRNDDLNSLLRLIDRDTFADSRALEQIIAANAPLIAARDAVLAGKAWMDIVELLDRAARHPLLRATKQLKKLRQEVVEAESNLSPDRRAELAARIERVNLLANIINRTRRRDVEEFRVVRNVRVHKAEMTPDERNVYDVATAAIHEYADEHDLPPGFLVVTPQRMLASCLPAAVGHWQGTIKTEGYEDEDGELETINADEVHRPLRSVLSRIAATLPTARELEAHDTKYELFRNALSGLIEQEPTHKIVVFSTFRATLEYLGRRLKKDGIAALVMHGGVGDRTALVEQFRVSLGIPVFLSSEVGSEGIDLQFARTVVNYDLPWNPMRVEQRIGRIDRLGQEAEAITVVNLLHRNTIDERIYDRLYHRLRLCEQALGGFEDILGDEVRQLTKDLLSGGLTLSEQVARIARSEQAIANRRAHEDELERDGAALIQHGEYVLRSIREARDENRWISSDDVADFIKHALNTCFPGCDLRVDQSREQLELALSAEARHEYETWSTQKGNDPGSLVRAGGASIFRLGQESGHSRHSKMTQTHPFMRFLSHRLGRDNLLFPNAVAMRCTSLEASDLPPGRYAGAVQAWSTGQGNEESLRLAYGLIDCASGEKINPDLAERALRRGLPTATRWTTAVEELDINSVAELLENWVEKDLLERFHDERERRDLEISDRIAIQVSALEVRALEDRRKLELQIISSGRKLEAANRARLDRLEENVKLRRLKIEAAAQSMSHSRDIAIILLDITT
ncbi:DEAD/DEAH box helicase [Pseudogemmobacter sp. W21_MBD1_M6]|uniref:DEAD/DEAH box helicase n=1 Tax=Pseudogemmobacter sp. W21_MBD1_M6 TaxID=3240271 RepID=UPI003F9CCA25